jgi:hypothetical protein
MVLGTMLHVMFAEMLVQPSVTVPVVPGNAVSVNPNIALLPGVVFTVEGLPGASPIVTGEFPLLNVAVTVWAAVIVTEHPPVPVQPAPLHPANVDPSEAVAVSATTVPLAKAAEHVVVGGQTIPAGLLVTVPVPLPASFTVKVKLFAFAAKLATTVVAAVIVNVQVPVPSQGPAPQPVNVDPAEAVAVNVIWVPLAKPEEHAVPQLMPVGTLFTVPVPFPAGVIRSVTFVLAPIVAVTLAVLFGWFGSGRSETTVAVFTTVPVAAAFTVTTTVTVACAAFATVPRLQDTTVVPVQAAPWEPVADTSVAFVGNVSDTIVFVASLGPAFVTLSV